LKRDELKHMHSLGELKRKWSGELSRIDRELRNMKHRKRKDMTDSREAWHMDKIRMWQKLEQQKVRSKKKLKTITRRQKELLHELRALKALRSRWSRVLWRRSHALSIMKTRMRKLHNMVLSLLQESKHVARTTGRMLRRTRKRVGQRLAKETAKQIHLKSAIQKLKVHVEKVLEGLRKRAKTRKSKKSELERSIAEASKKLRQQRKREDHMEKELENEMFRAEEAFFRFTRGSRYGSRLCSVCRR